ncbi:MAG: inositol monophosphatase [Rhodothermales bacterium]|nr:inositol monophosphatase [Rhodothermales bacterium]
MVSHPLHTLIAGLHDRIVSDVVSACRQQDVDVLAGVDRQESDDTIYAIDAVSESHIDEHFRERATEENSIVVIAEGFPGEGMTYPKGTASQDAKWRVIIDPIDGTRGLMYQKRSAWILTGVAPNKGESTTLIDIEFAIQTEIPTIKQNLYDRLWATSGSGVTAERQEVGGKNRLALAVKPSRARTIEHGFSTVSRFFPGGREVLASIDDELVESLIGPVQKGRAACFEDQYISTGGQLYSLVTGKDRFIADLRPVVYRAIESTGVSPGITCHPYDVCTELIAREAGVVITDTDGQRLNYRLDTESEVTWIGYANSDLHDIIWPHLLRILRQRSLVD